MVSACSGGMIPVLINGAPLHYWLDHCEAMQMCASQLSGKHMPAVAHAQFAQRRYVLVRLGPQPQCVSRICLL